VIARVSPRRRVFPTLGGVTSPSQATPPDSSATATTAPTSSTVPAGATPRDEMFSVWAPTARGVGLVLDSPDADPDPMRRAPGGWWASGIRREQGTDYGFVVAGDDDEVGPPRPDPRSPREPNGVHGLSRVHRLDASRWTDEGWTGRELAGSVIYEMHVGTFSAGGTLTSAIGHLDELVELGVDM